MYPKILVSLDGSKPAECVLNHVEEIAKGYDTQMVILVRVIERVNRLIQRTGTTHLTTPLMTPAPISEIPVPVHKKQQQVERYLDKIANRLDKKGIKGRLEVLLRQPAEEIVHYA